MSVSSILYPKFRAEDSNGDPLIGGKLYTYIPGSTVLKPTYSDLAQTIANTNPVILDSRGEATLFGTGDYKFILKDENDVTVWSLDAGVYQTAYVNNYYQVAATSGQTVFSLPWSYDHTGQAIRVYVNGAHQPRTAYTCTSATSVTMGAGVTAGQIVEFESITSAVVDTIFANVAAYEASTQAYANAASASAASSLASSLASAVSASASAASSLASAVSASASAASAAQAAADVVLTHADVVLTHADVALTHADVVSTGEDADATAADRVQTGLDRVATAADRVQTGEDAASAAASAAAASAVTGIPAFGAGDAGKAMVVNPGETAYTLSAVQAPLVSGTNIKTVNGGSLLGSGDIAVVSSVYRDARTSNTALAAADKGKLIDITANTFTQTFAAAATLGDGWFCYLRNSGTGDITLDPDGSELIDGLASYIMYPGETRLVQCTGTAFYSIVINPFFREFTTAGTFTKPPGYSLFSGLAWGGGGSGGKGDAQRTVGGGGGGACTPFSVHSSSVGATETVTIGAGGVAITADTTPGNVGGTTTLGALVASYGGGGGGADAGLAMSGGTGGGSVGAGRVGSTIAAINYGGKPSLLNATGNPQDNPGYGGGGVEGGIPGSAMYGGAAGGGNVAGGKSVWGGGGGGPGYATNSIAGGTSTHGGAGGMGNNTIRGVDGTAPGGGGGGTRTGTTSGAGARGELRIWGVI